MKHDLYRPSLASDIAATAVPVRARVPRWRCALISSPRWRRAALRAASALAFFGAGCMSAQASAVYTFAGAPLTAVSFSNGGSINLITPVEGLKPSDASLTFNTLLAPNSTTAISAESGGFDLLSINGSSMGNVQSFTADADVFDKYGSAFRITSGLTDYKTDPQVGDRLSIDHYSTLVGSVTTDAVGNLSAWNLHYILWQLDGGIGTVCAGPACTPSVNTLGPDLELLIRSGAPVTDTITYVALNGVPPKPEDPHSFDINWVDTAMAEPGGGQIRSYTGEQGSWTVAGAADPGETVPEPGTVALMLLGGALGLWTHRRRA